MRVEGWQNKQFLGRGEFALPFGDYKVSITVPSDHIVAATGELKNATSVLTKNKSKDGKMQKIIDEPVIIVSQEEAEENEKEKSKNKKTWILKQITKRFYWASSRKFIWDAMAVDISGKRVMAYSYYPKKEILCGNNILPEW